MQYRENILQTIGKTPLVRLSRVTDGLPATVLAKVEYLNPGWQREGPHCPADDRGRGAARGAPAWRYDHLSHCRQHRRGTSTRGGGQRVPLDDYGGLMRRNPF